MLAVSRSRAGFGGICFFAARVLLGVSYCLFGLVAWLLSGLLLVGFFFGLLFDF